MKNDGFPSWEADSAPGQIGNEIDSTVMQTAEVSLLSKGLQNPIVWKMQTGAARIHTAF